MLNLDLLGNGENFLALMESIGKHVDALELHKKQFVELCYEKIPRPAQKPTHSSTNPHYKR